LTAETWYSAMALSADILKADVDGDWTGGFIFAAV
jgi:hypothetical protein